MSYPDDDPLEPVDFGEEKVEPFDWKGANERDSRDRYMTHIKSIMGDLENHFIFDMDVNKQILTTPAIRGHQLKGALISSPF